MTVAPDVPRLEFDDLAGAVAALRDRGFRLSTPRRLVLEALFAADGPTSAVHLAHALSIEESSVYRNLEVLEELGLVRHVHLGHGPGLYALSGRDEVEYLYCTRCSKVIGVPPDRLDGVRQEIKNACGFEGRFTHFAIVGSCEQCATSSRAAAEAAPHRPGLPDHPEPDQNTSTGELTHSHGGFVHTHPHGRADRGHGH